MVVAQREIMMAQCSTIGVRLVCKVLSLNLHFGPLPSWLHSFQEGGAQYDLVMAQRGTT